MYDFDLIYDKLTEILQDKIFLRNLKCDFSELSQQLERNSFRTLVAEITESADSRGRFNPVTVSEILTPLLSDGGENPEEGWAQYAYNLVLSQIFPEKITVEDDSRLFTGAGICLQILRGLHEIEMENADFDPTLDFVLLKEEEILEKGFNQEYIRLKKRVDYGYFVEFMRLGATLTPFNTLGHIAGVHYTAMHAARQLEKLGVPVDLGLISGAAIAHDVGKYGCRKSEERRIPYLHYYYTDLCMDRLGIPMIGYIAATHSTWDLELANLSVESLLLIYADFRVKSFRDSEGVEHVNFYSLEDSFQVILNKLDNVDSAKEHRYRRVYNKLKDFEDYMKNLGVDVNLPEKPAAYPKEPVPVPKKDMSLVRSSEIAVELKHEAIDHNIRLMNLFYNENEFGSILETARSEKRWKSLRTYVSILGEYSTYMTEKQKLMTLRFLNELLTHKESDIRNQAGEIIGRIIARFNNNFRKELPEGVSLPEKKITNITLWSDTIQNVLVPDYKLTELHKKWTGNTLKAIGSGLMEAAHPDERSVYIDCLLPWLKRDDLSEITKQALLRTVMEFDPQWLNEEQTKAVDDFAEALYKEDSRDKRIAAALLKDHFGTGKPGQNLLDALKEALNLEQGSQVSEEELSAMYLDNLKANTPWIEKVANIVIMLGNLKADSSHGQALHVATHLGNLVKVSETVTVRKNAGRALVEIIDLLPLEQRNEIAVELGKGLEIEDYQFSKYIPDYLGVIMLHLPPRELDELLTDLEQYLYGTNSQVATAVLHTFGVILEHYNIYRENFGDDEEAETTEKRKKRLVGMLLRGYANYIDPISQEALWTIGMDLFGSQILSRQDKFQLYRQCGKKVLAIREEGKFETEIDFFNDTAAFNKIYGFIAEYELEEGPIEIPENNRIAFFPGTFDPFSLSHKAIAQEIRNMGYEVYLAIDEFSWSKKTQPRLHRKKILSCSIADEEGIYIFPDRIPVNIANPRDLKELKDIFAGKELFLVAGSDVIENASCYRAAPQEHSIHSMNHIVFKRFSDENKILNPDAKVYPITGNVTYLKLDEHYEDISSTRIRDNIDMNRDISNLIDPIAQNYIYEKGLYLREPAYKHVIQSHEMELIPFAVNGSEIIEDMAEELAAAGHDMDAVRSYLSRSDVKTIGIRDSARGGKVVAVAGFSKLETRNLLTVFNDRDLTAYIRSYAAGSIALLGGIFVSKDSEISNAGQLVIIELLSELLAKDYTYAVYNPCEDGGYKEESVEILTKQGFVDIAIHGDRPIYGVDMKEPAIVFKNVDTIIKNPLNKNPKVLKAVEKAHDRLLARLREMYPGELILSYNANIMHHKLIKLLTKINGVPDVPQKKKAYGPYMAVPFGLMLENVAIPNSVTKALHTEKYFAEDVSTFTIEEVSYYATLENQVKTIRSFGRPIVLVDDLLHKGYRMKKLVPVINEAGVKVIKGVFGVQTGRGHDLAMDSSMDTASAYFLPNLKCWMDEKTVYPYIGGDSMKNPAISVESKGEIPALNLIMPYAVPSFLGEMPKEKVYEYSMTCLENARDILKVLEEEYQNTFEQKLTIRRMGEVIARPKKPALGENIEYNENVAPSRYVENDIAKLIRMKRLFR